MWYYNAALCQWELRSLIDNRVIAFVTDELIYRGELELLAAHLYDKLGSLPPPLSDYYYYPPWRK